MGNSNGSKTSQKFFSQKNSKNYSHQPHFKFLMVLVGNTFSMQLDPQNLAYIWKLYRSTIGEILMVISQRVFKWGSANQFILNDVSSMLSTLVKFGQHRGYFIKDKLVSTTPFEYRLRYHHQNFTSCRSIWNSTLD